MFGEKFRKVYNCRNNPMFSWHWGSLLKHYGENKKTLVISIFPISHNLFFLVKSNCCKRWYGICQGSQYKGKKYTSQTSLDEHWEKNEQAQGRTDIGMNTWQRLSVSLRQWNAIAAIDIFNKKRVFLWSMP